MSTKQVLLNFGKLVLVSVALVIGTVAGGIKENIQTLGVPHGAHEFEGSFAQARRTVSWITFTGAERLKIQVASPRSRGAFARAGGLVPDMR